MANELLAFPFALRFLTVDILIMRDLKKEEKTM